MTKLTVKTAADSLPSHCQPEQRQMTKPYVILFHEDYFSLIGPFADDDAARDGGARWQEEHNDHPCWQLVHLTDEQVASPLPLYAPADMDDDEEPPPGDDEIEAAWESADA